MGKIYSFDDLNGEKKLLDILVEKGAYVTSPCGGNGTCGKCKVKVDGEVVLSCKVYPTGSAIVELIDENEEEIEVVSLEEDAEVFVLDDELRPYCVAAIDIGTTTLAGAVVDYRTGDVVKAAGGINHQRAFGGDVISRIKASSSGKKKALQDSIYKDLKELMIKMGAKGLPAIIAGNTTMGHLLMGYDCDSLGVAPYTPVDISAQFVELPIYDDESSLRAGLVPGISAYVGADITAGIYCADMDVSDKVVAVIDLGTNGEMAIGNKDRIVCSSTAAGPAFEGGNISCGMAGIPGAISHIAITKEDKRAELEDLISRKRLTGITETGDFLVGYKTIGDKSPKGLCGSGLIDVIAEMVRNEIIDETGLIDDEFFDDGFVMAYNGDEPIAITEQDVREMQMAKSAIRAGFETLRTELGAEYEEIESLYLAGGFGQKISIDKACEIGIIPTALKYKTVGAGNTSLRGALLLAEDLYQSGNSEMDSFEEARKSCKSADRMIRIADTSEEIALATNVHFNEFYMDYMMFESD